MRAKAAAGSKVLDRTLYATLLAALFFSLLRPISGVDLWTYLAAGEWIFRAGAVPRVDVFSWTSAGRPWMDHEWLSNLIIYILYRAAGLSAAILAKAGVIAAVFALADQRLRARGVGWPGRAAALAATAWACSSRWSERADLATLLALSGLLCRLEGGAEPRWRAASWAAWPALFALWANLHGGFLIGFALIGVFAGAACLRDRGAIRAWAVWAGACALATAVTPYGIELHRELLRWSAEMSRRTVYEWMPPRWPGFESYWAALAALWLSFLARGRSSCLWPDLGSCALLSALSARHLRFVPFFLVLAAPMTAVNLAGVAVFRRLGAALSRREAPALAAALSAAFLAAAVSARDIAGGVSRLEAHDMREAADFISAEGARGPFYNDYPLGSGWIWRFKGAPPVFIDGRISTVAGYDQLMAEVSAAQASPGAWTAFLDRRGIQAAAVRYPFPSDALAAPIFRAFFPRSRWALVYWDDVCLVFARRAGPNAELARRREYRAVEPEATEAYLAAALRSGALDTRAWLEELRRNLVLHPDSARTRRLLRLAASSFL